jgi:membrane-associated phospholipid phosphatase
VSTRWDHELLPLDEPVKRNFSPPAARASDALLAASVLGPLAAQAGQGLDAEAGKRALILGEAVAVSLAGNAVTKRLVRRPRPYVYNPDPDVEAYARGEGADARLSFYSGHAATAFAAAVAGGYLFSQSTSDVAARTAVWGGGLFLAGATSALRVRAGKHFVTDVVAGAAAGTLIGWAVPALHLAGGQGQALRAPEWIAIGAAPAAGAALAALVPLPERAPRPVLVPWASGQAGGLVLAGRF